MTDRSIRERLDAAIDAAVPSVAPALAISAWRSGRPWYEASVGWVDPASESIPVGQETLFDLASLTKLFTTTAMLCLVSDGRVDLDDAVVGLIPEFGSSGPRGVDGGQEPLSRRLLPTPPDRAKWSVDPAIVTIRQLLTHTGGLAPWRSLFRLVGPVPPPPGEADPIAREVRLRRALDVIGGYPFVARPGAEVHYSDLGFILLGVAVARVFGAALDVAIGTLVRDRLGLGSLTYAPVADGRARETIAPTSVDDDWRHRRCWGEVEDENAGGLGGVAGHAGIFATAHDVARFGDAWLHHQRDLGLERSGAAAVIDQTPSMGVARGLGWQVQPTDYLAPSGPRAFGHTGFTGTSLMVDPDRDLVVALLANRVYAGRTQVGIDELRLEIHRIAAEAS